MPIVTATEAPERRKRGSKALWLLLVPPALVVALLLTVAVQPLQLGPYVLLGDPIREHGPGWLPIYYDHASALPNPTPFTFRNHRFTVTGEGWTFILSLGDWRYGLACFRGHRAP